MGLTTSDFTIATSNWESSWTTSIIIWTVLCITLCTYTTTINEEIMLKLIAPISALYLTAMESMKWKEIYMELLPYRIRFGVMVSYLGTLYNRRSGRLYSRWLYNRLVSEWSMKPTSGNVAICGFSQVNTIPAPVRLRISTRWGTRLTTLCC